MMVSGGHKSSTGLNKSFSLTFTNPGQPFQHPRQTQVDKGVANHRCGGVDIVLEQGTVFRPRAKQQFIGHTLLLGIDNRLATKIDRGIHGRHSGNNGSMVAQAQTEQNHPVTHLSYYLRDIVLPLYLSCGIQ